MFINSTILQVILAVIESSQKLVFILPVIVYLLTVETKKNCYNFSYLNRIACQYSLIVLLL